MSLKMRVQSICLALIIFIQHFDPHAGFQTAEDGQQEAFPAYAPGFVGVTLEPHNLERELVLEGAASTPEALPRLYGDAPRAQQVCPAMVGPLGDGRYYCRAREYGFCDRRTGVCHCRRGYQGVDCGDCAPSHFLNGTLCYPKILCPNDCSKRGRCDYYDGKCHCDDFRTGDDCSEVICRNIDELCAECTEDGVCVRCDPGYYLDEDGACASCTRHDPRCVACDEYECLSCADPLLLSIRRSGRRRHDPELPAEDATTRELSWALPFGTVDPGAFAEAEPFRVVLPPQNATALGNLTRACAQGADGTAAWACAPAPRTHAVCGHEGTLAWGSPTYAVDEDAQTLRVTTTRTGGGFGRVQVEYILEHVTTDADDVTATAPYTSGQVLTFEEGVIELGILISIHDDRTKEGDEYFRLRLMQPQGGARLGSQHTAVVKIIDDDAALVSHEYSYIEGLETATAGVASNFTLRARTASDVPLQTGGARWLGALQPPPDPSAPAAAARRPPPNGGAVAFEDLGNGSYAGAFRAGAQGPHLLRVWLLEPEGLLGTYFEDEFFSRRRLQRVDPHVNFDWGHGRLTEYAGDHVSVTWEGHLRAEYTETYNLTVRAAARARLWVDGALAVDAWDWGPGEATGAVAMEAGQFYRVALEYRAQRGAASVQLLWEGPSTAREVVPSSRLYVARELAGSPFPVAVVSAASAAATSIAYGEGLASGTAGVESHFTIIPKDRFGNLRNDAEDGFIPQADIFKAIVNMTANDAQGMGARELAAAAAWDPAAAAWALRYTPTAAGTYAASVLYLGADRLADGEHVLGSPFQVEVAPAEAHARRCEATGEGLTTGKAGYSQNFTIVARDAFNNYLWRGGDKFELYAYSRNHSDVVAVGAVEDVGNGTYSGALVPEVAGHYWLRATLGGQDVAEGPYALLVTYGDPTGYTSTVEGGLGWAAATANLQNFFVIQARDAFGNKVLDDDFSVTAYINAPTNISASYSTFGNGTVLIYYVPEVIGINELRVYLEGSQIAGSPFTVAVEPGPLNASTSTATGGYLYAAEAGEHATFRIQARDDTSNPLDTGNTSVFNVTLNGAANLSGWVAYEGNGVYTGHYIAKTSGYYDLHVIEISTGLDIKDSPFPLYVSPSYVDASKSLLRGAGIEEGVAGVAGPVWIQAVDRFGNNRTGGGDTFVISVYDTAALGNTTATDNKDGTYYIEHTPTVAGDYTVNITVYQPRGLWVHYYYTEEFYQPTSTAVDPNIDHDWGIGAPVAELPTDFFGVQWHGHVRAPHSEEFTFHVAADRGARVRLKVDGVALLSSDDRARPALEYSASWVLSAGSFHEIELRYSHHDGAAAVALAWSSPSLPRETIPTKRCYRLLTVTDRVYPVTWEPAAVDPPRSTATGAPLAGTEAVGAQSFLLEARDAFGNLRWDGGETVSVYGNGPGDSSFAAEVEDNENGTYTITIEPTVAGYYTVTSIILSSRPSDDYGYYTAEEMVSQYNIQDSPKLVYFSDAETHAGSTTVFGRAAAQAVAGVAEAFVVQARDRYANRRTSGGDAFEVYVALEDADARYDEGAVYLEDIEYTAGGQYVVRYNLTVAGDHRLHILLDGEPVGGSPFPLHVTPGIAHAANCEVVNWRHPKLGEPSAFTIKTADVFGNPLEHGGEEFYITVHGEDLVYGTALDNGDGTYSGAYNLSAAGTYDLSVQLADRATPGRSGGRGLKAAGYNNLWLQGNPVISRIDPYINYVYGWELMTDSATNLVSFRWTGYLKSHHSELFTFEVKTSMHVRIFVQEALILDTKESSQGTAALIDNRLHSFIVEAVKSKSSSGSIALYWESINTPKQIVPTFYLYPSVKDVSNTPRIVVS